MAGLTSESGDHERVAQYLQPGHSESLQLPHLHETAWSCKGVLVNLLLAPSSTCTLALANYTSQTLLGQLRFSHMESPSQAGTQERGKPVFTSISRLLQAAIAVPEHRGKRAPS